MVKKFIAATGLTGLIGSRIEELTVRDIKWQALRYEDGFDITSAEKVDDAIKQFRGEALLHLAAFTDLDAANKERGNNNGMCYRINVLGTRNIARSCGKYGKYLIHVSTDSVFGGHKKTPYGEDDKPNPIEWYGQTKTWAEEKVIKSGCKAVIVRFAYPFRNRFAPKKDFVWKIVDRLKRGEKISPFSDTVFTPTFVDDIAAAVKIILTKKPSGILHVVGSTALSPYQAAVEVAKVFDLDEKLIEPQTLDDYLESGGRPYPRFAALSNKKLKTDLGVSMRTFPDALREIKIQLSTN